MSQFQEIWIVFTDDGFVSVLKEVSITLMSAVEVDRITSKELPHANRQELLSCPRQQMKMLCEAQNYVKLSSFISGLPFIFRNSTVAASINSLGNKPCSSRSIFTLRSTLIE